MQQLLDLLARQFTSACELAEHAFAVGACLVDHLAALLLGHRQLGFGVGCRIGATTRRLDLGLLAHARCLVTRFAQQLRGALFGLLADLGGALACRGQHPCRLLTEQPGQRLFVHLHRRQVGIGLRRTELAFEETFAFLQTPEFGRHHAQEVADLTLVETTAAGTECGVGNRRR